MSNEIKNVEELAAICAVTPANDYVEKSPEMEFPSDLQKKLVPSVPIIVIEGDKPSNQHLHGIEFYAKADFSVTPAPAE